MSLGGGATPWCEPTSGQVLFFLVCVCASLWEDVQMLEAAGGQPLWQPA